MGQSKCEERGFKEQWSKVLKKTLEGFKEL
jgi:hypothetical protein